MIVYFHEDHIVEKDTWETDNVIYTCVDGRLRYFNKHSKTSGDCGNHIELSNCWLLSKPLGKDQELRESDYFNEYHDDGRVTDTWLLQTDDKHYTCSWCNLVCYDVTTRTYSFRLPPVVRLKNSCISALPFPEIEHEPLLNNHFEAAKRLNIELVTDRDCVYSLPWCGIELTIPPGRYPFVNYCNGLCFKIKEGPTHPDYVDDLFVQIEEHELKLTFEKNVPLIIHNCAGPWNQEYLREMGPLLVGSIPNLPPCLLYCIGSFLVHRGALQV